MAFFSVAALVLGATVIPAWAFILPRSTNTSLVSIPLINSANQAYMVPTKMGSGTGQQQFGFQLSSTNAYTIVAGNGCTTCSSNSSAPKYNPSLSSTYVAPAAGAANNGQITTTLNGKAVVGVVGRENCAFHQANGSFWSYPNQAIVVAGSSSDSSSVPGSGMAGLGQSSAVNPTDSLVGQYLAGHPDLNGTFTFGLALNSADQTNTGSDSSGGTMHIFQSDPSFYTGQIGTVQVASPQTQESFGAVPPQLGSYDWTVQLGGWNFSPGDSGQDVSGGQGTYVTIEPFYPYIKLMESDATKIYAAIPGSQQYTVAADAVTTSNVPVFQDPNALSWSIPCSASGLALTINVGGVTINVQPTDLFTSIGGVCVGNVKGWTNSTAQTYIFGSAFLRSAYLVFNANSNSQSNSIGFAARAFAAKSSKSEAGPIAGGVVGGLAFIALLAVGVFFFIRHRRRDATPPSATFTSEGNLVSTEKSRSFFGFSGSKDKNDDHLAADPWVGGGSSENGTVGGPAGQNVTVQPWLPNAPGEQAFLSPSGTATTFNGSAAGGMMPSAGSPGPHAQYGSQQGMTPPPASTTPGSVGYDGYDRSSMGGAYSQVPNTANPLQPQAMWVERSNGN